MNNLVYLLEDDESICNLISCAFEMTNIELKVFNTINDFKKELSNKKCDVCLLDIMLPDGNGLNLLEEIKTKYSSISVIMLSALGQEFDKVKGLNKGADDYISKPFSVLELLARVNARLRDKKHVICESGRIKIDEQSFLAYLDGEKLELNNKEFHLLNYFVKNEGIVLSREKILDTIWGYSIGETRTVDNHVARLRKLGITEIETVFSVGYKYQKKE